MTSRSQSRFIADLLRTGILLLAFCCSLSGAAQPVKVTMLFDTNRLAVGQTTLLHVFAEITPDEKPATLQIFSWYVDLLNESASIATADYGQVKRAASDQDPRLSSGGVSDGANRRGIFDTFLNSPGAGHDGPIELFSVPVTATAVGQATFSVTAGTGVSSLTADFFVAPEGGGDPLTGGDYTDASASLDASKPTVTPVPIRIAETALGAGQTSVTITFLPQSGANQYVESTDALGPAATWRVLPGAPHNSGIAAETNSVPMRFYRLRIDSN
jgi:hypothetical protein